MHVTLVDEHTGFVKQVKVGYSWTMFFWGCLPPLFRADWKYFFIILVLNVISFFLTMGIATTALDIVFAFYYNKLYTKDLVEKGYRPAGQQDKDILVGKGYVSNNLELSTMYNK